MRVADPTSNNLPKSNFSFENIVASTGASPSGTNNSGLDNNLANDFASHMSNQSAADLADKAESKKAKLHIEAADFTVESVRSELDESEQDELLASNQEVDEFLAAIIQPNTRLQDYRDFADNTLDVGFNAHVHDLGNLESDLLVDFGNNEELYLPLDANNLVPAANGDTDQFALLSEATTTVNLSHGLEVAGALGERDSLVPSFMPSAKERLQGEDLATFGQELGQDELSQTLAFEPIAPDTSHSISPFDDDYASQGLQLTAEMFEQASVETTPDFEANFDALSELDFSVRSDSSLSTMTTTTGTSDLESLESSASSAADSSATATLGNNFAFGSGEIGTINNKNETTVPEFTLNPDHPIGPNDNEWSNDVADIISQQMYAGNLKHVSIKLNPTELGPINLELVLDSTLLQATVNFEIANKETQKLLEQHANSVSNRIVDETQLLNVSLNFTSFGQRDNLDRSPSQSYNPDLAQSSGGAIEAAALSNNPKISKHSGLIDIKV